MPLGLIVIPRERWAGDANITFLEEEITILTCLMLLVVYSSKSIAFLKRMPFPLMIHTVFWIFQISSIKKGFYVGNWMTLPLTNCFGKAISFSSSRENGGRIGKRLVSFLPLLYGSFYIGAFGSFALLNNCDGGCFCSIFLTAALDFAVLFTDLLVLLTVSISHENDGNNKFSRYTW